MINVDALMVALRDYIREESLYREGEEFSWKRLQVAENTVYEKLENLNAALARLETMILATSNVALSASKTADQAMMPHRFIGPGLDWYGQGQVTTQPQPGISWNADGTSF